MIRATTIIVKTALHLNLQNICGDIIEWQNEFKMETQTKY